MTRQAREQFVSTLAILLTLAVGGAFVGGHSGGLLVPIAAVLVMAYAKGRLVILDLPYDPLVVDFVALRHSRSDQDAGVQWLLREITEAARAV